MSLRVVQAVLLLLSAILFFWPCLTDASPIVVTDASPNALPEMSPITPRDVSACKLPANQKVLLSTGFGYHGGPNSECLDAVGTVTGFMMFVDFPDAPHAELSGQEMYDWFFPDAADWLKHASYDRLRLEVRSDTRYYRMAQPSTAWEGLDGALPPDKLYEYINEAITAYTANGQHMPSADILYIVPTFSAKAHIRSATYPYVISRRADNSLIARKTVFFGQGQGSTAGPNSPLHLIHETGHAFCLADLYNILGQDGYRWVGGWSLMGTEEGASPDLFAWDKWRLGWIDDSDIDCLSTTGSYRYVLKPLYRNKHGKKALVIVRNRKTALVAEYRLDGGVDTTTCSPGLLLYTVNTEIPNGHGPIRVIDANPKTTGCDNLAANDATLSITGKRFIRVGDFDVTVEVASQSFTEIAIDVNRL